MTVLSLRVKLLLLLTILALSAACGGSIALAQPQTDTDSGACYVWYGGRGGKAIYVTMTIAPGRHTDGAAYVYLDGVYTTYTTRLDTATYAGMDYGRRDIRVSVYNSRYEWMC